MQEEIKDLLEKADYPGALAKLEEFAGNISSLQDCEFVRHCLAGVREVPENFTLLRIAVLRSFLFEPWVPFLATALFRNRIVAEIQLGDFDVFEDYLREDSDLALFRPDAVLLAFETRTVFKDLFFSPPWSRANGLESFRGMFLARIEQLTTSLDRMFSSKLIVMNLAPPPIDYFWPASAQVPHSLVNMIRAINCDLAGYAKKLNSLAIFDIGYEAARFGLDNTFDRRMWNIAANPFPTPFIARAAGSLADMIGILNHPGKKCVVVDLDNTLWGGILGEDGEGNLKIGTTYPGVNYREFQLYLKALREKGILLAINSKNNEADCLAFIRNSSEMVLKETDFACMRINWDNKAENMRAIARELNLGLDAFVFIDDSPYECEMVKTLLPEVSVYRMPLSPLEIPPFIASIPGLVSVKVLEEDLKRNEYYLAEKNRQAFQGKFQTVDEYMAGLKMELTIGEAEPQSIPRVAQLTQKTNQFNLTTHRYQESDILRFMSDGCRIYTLRMRDIFGDYGLVGVAIIKPRENGAWVIDTFLLSCRVLGRSVENAFLRYSLDEIGSSGGTTVFGEYIKTGKNGQVRDLYSRLDFREQESSEERAVFVLDLARDAGPKMPSHFVIHTGKNGENRCSASACAEHG